MDKDKSSNQAKPAQPESLEASTPTAPASDAKAADNKTGPSKSGGQAAASKSGDEKRSPIRKLLDFSKLYLIMFALVLVIAGLAVLISVSMSKQKSSTKTPKTSSLTGSQLAQIQGNTTLVGDPKQTLDIQGNAIFEGQGLFRGDLSVASDLKVGGAISAQGINIGGTANFGQLQVSQKLSVNGDFSLSGQLNVQKGLTVAGNGSFTGALTASSLTVSNITINGDFSLNRHLTINGSVPSASAGTAVGIGGTVSVNGTDTAGTVNINTGSSPPAGNLAIVTFATKYAKTPYVVVTPIGSSAAGLQFYVTRNANGFTLATANAPPAGVSFNFDYVVID